MALDMAEAGLVFDEDLGIVYEGYTLDHKTAKSFGFLFTDEDLSESIAKAEGVNNTMVGLLDAFQQRQSPQQMVDGGLINFAKREQNS